MTHGWQTITGQEEVWIKIPLLSDKYELSNLGRVRAFYKYKDHSLCPHHKILKPDGNNVKLDGKKYNIPKLMQECFGIRYCDVINGEIWKDIDGFEDLYQISNMGRIKAKSSYVLCYNGKQFYKHERIIKTCVINTGYERVLLHKDKMTSSALVHRLVAEHFIPNPNNEPQVNHKNENKLDNRVDNLEWCSRIYNANYGTCQIRRINTRLANNNRKYGVPRKRARSTCVEK